MGQEEELNYLSNKLISYVNSNPNLRQKGVYQIYNEWVASDNIHIEYKENLQWCFLYIKDTLKLTKDNASKEMLITILSMCKHGGKRNDIC